MGRQRFCQIGEKTVNWRRRTSVPRVGRRPGSRGFDFTAAMRHVCADICARLPELRHIRCEQVAVGFAQARNRSAYGLYATLTPLRFEGGQRYERRYSRTYMIQGVRNDRGPEMLYILTFYLPRFQDLDFQQKLITIFHELWHISPACDGDIRRFEGRCFAHSSSQRDFDEHAKQLAETWLALEPPAELYDFLKLRFDQLVTRHGRVFGSRYSQPKILPVPEGSGEWRDREPGVGNREPGVGGWEPGR